MDMHFSSAMSLVAGVLQFAVACYALRLNRLFGSSRVGWSLFVAFAAMALLRLLLSLDLFRGVIVGVGVEIVYVLTSILLLTGMAHLETLLKERQRVESVEHNAQARLESQVREQT